MVSAKAVITDESGLHLKPAAVLCEEALKFRSTVTFTVRDTTANAKSVLSVLGACVRCGEEIEIVCDGEDEKLALSTLTAMIKRGLANVQET